MMIDEIIERIKGKIAYYSHLVEVADIDKDVFKIQSYNEILEGLLQARDIVEEVRDKWR